MSQEEENIDSLFEPVPSSVTLKDVAENICAEYHQNKRCLDDISAIEDTMDVLNQNSEPIQNRRRVLLKNEENSIETGSDMKIIERIELLEFQMESVRSDLRIARLERDEHKEKLDRHLTGTRLFWDKTNKELVSYHRNKLHDAIEKLATYSVEKMKGIHTLIAKKQASLADRLSKTENALRDCWFITDMKVTKLLEKEEEQKGEVNTKDDDDVFEDV